MSSKDVEEITCDDEIGKIIHNDILSNFCKRYVLVGPERTSIPEMYLKHENNIKNFEVYDDDIWVISYPKTGTTWTQEMVWMIANNVNFNEAKTSLDHRFPFLEISAIADREKMYEVMNVPIMEYWNDSVNYVKNVQRPRFVKSHLPFSLLPDQLKNGSKTPKIVYVVRNPKDACVSFYHHGTLLLGWRPSLDNFAKVFMAEKSMYGSYWKHVLGYWKRQTLPNYLIIKYEDMKSDLASVIRKVAHFLEKELTDEQVQLLCKHLSFESMKSSPALNKEDHVKNLRKYNLVVKDGSFIRSGTVGKYKEELGPETILKFNEWIKKSTSGTALEKEDIFQI